MIQAERTVARLDLGGSDSRPGVAGLPIPSRRHEVVPSIGKGLLRSGASLDPRLLLGQRSDHLIAAATSTAGGPLRQEPVRRPR